MRNTLKTTTMALLLASTLVGCSLSYYRHTSYADYQTLDGADVNVSMTLHGEMRVNPQETEIDYLAPGSRIKVSSRRSTTKQQLILQGLEGGEVGVDYELNGKPAEFDAQAKAWFASVVPTLYGQSGVNIPERVEKLYRVGGEQLVLDRIEPINGDSAQGRYLSYLFENKPLSDEGLERSMTLLEHIQSDYELSKVMRSLATSQSLSEKNWLGLLDQSKDIQSDVEMGKLFISLRKTDLPSNILSELSYVAAGYIQSDYEQAKVLKAFIKDKQYQEKQWLDLLDSSKAIQSDSEHARLLEQMLSHELSETVLLAVIEVTRSQINSSVSQSDVLAKLIKRNELTPALKRAVSVAIDEVGSTSEQNKLLKLLVA